MTSSVEINQQELNEILNALQNLAKKIEYVDAIKALKAAAEPILDAAIGKAPVGETGRLADSLKIVTGKRNRRNRKGAGPFVQVKADGWIAGYAHLVEYGHVIAKKTFLGFRKIFGYVPPKPFMRPAFDENSERAIAILVSSLKSSIQNFK